MKKSVFSTATLLVLLLALSVPAMAATPASRVLLVKTKTNGAVYAVVNNQRVPIASPSEFKAKGYAWKNLKIITDKKMQAIPLSGSDKLNQAAVATRPAGASASPNQTVAVPVASAPDAAINQTVVPTTPPSQSTGDYVRPNQMQIQEVGSFDTSGRLFAINNRGQVVAYGNRTTPDGSSQIIFWDNGVTTVIPEAVTPLALNSKGQVLFLSNLPGGGSTVGLWSDGKSILFKGFDKTLYHIDNLSFGDDGVAYGTAYSGCGRAPEDSCTDYFKITSGGVVFLKNPVKKSDLPRAIQVPGTTQAHLQKINSHGQGIGWANYQVGKELDFGQQTIFWDNGAVSRLKGFNATDINNAGEVMGSGPLGYAYPSDDERSLMNTDIFNALTPYGDVVYWHNGHAINLTQIAMLENKIYLQDAVDINDNGQIIAAGTRLGSSARSYYVISMPEKNPPPTFQFTRELGGFFTLASENDRMKAWVAMVNRDAANNTYTIQWISDDVDNATTISLYYNTDNTGTGGTLIAKDIKQPSGHNESMYVWDATAARADLFNEANLNSEGPASQPECKYGYDDNVRWKNGAIKYAPVFDNCHIYPQHYYLYAVIDDGVNSPRVVYSKTKIQL